jgi:hypothetical protein
MKHKPTIAAGKHLLSARVALLVLHCLLAAAVGPTSFAYASDTIYITRSLAGDTVEISHRFSGVGEEFVVNLADAMPESYGNQLSLISAPPGNGTPPVQTTVRRSGDRGEIHQFTCKVDYSRSFIKEEIICYVLEPTLANKEPVVILFRFSAKGRLVTYDEYRHCFITDANIVLNEDRPFVQIAWNGFGIGKFFAYQIEGNASGHQIVVKDTVQIKCNENDLYFTPGQSILVRAKFSDNRNSPKKSTFVLKSDFHASDSLVIVVW